MRYHIWTIGCQMNVADSRRAADALEALGLARSDTPEGADVLVLNSCVVRQRAEDRVYGRLSSLKPLKDRRPHLLIALMGCAVQEDAEPLRRRFPYVDLFLRPAQVKPLVEAVRRHLDSSLPPGRLASHPLSPVPAAAYVPIAHGCDNFCTYCIVPLRRGPMCSRRPDEILREVEEWVRRGAREVTLLGQNVDAYGKDLSDPVDLADLIRSVHEVQGLQRLRFLTSHPTDMSQRLLDTVAELPKACEHIEVPVQSGDDDILRRMGRGYDSAYYRDLVARSRDTIPGLSLATDVIVGFPGESLQQFLNTYQLLEDLRFDVVHIASYSPRPGTSAARLPDDVPPEEKRRRHRAVEGLHAPVASEINARLLGRVLEVLVEGQKKDKWMGRTRSNKLVFFPHSEDLRGKLVPVRIIETSPWSLQGQLVDES